MKDRDMYFVVCRRDPDGCLEEWESFRSVANAMHYLHSIDEDGYEMRRVSKKELLLSRWQEYEEIAELIDKKWKCNRRIIAFMYDIVDSLRSSLQNAREYGSYKHKSLVSYAELYEHGQLVRLRLETTESEKCQLFLERRGDYETTWRSIVMVRAFNNINEVFDWSGEWREAALSCEEAFRRSHKRDILHELLALPEDTPFIYSADTKIGIKRIES